MEDESDIQYVEDINSNDWVLEELIKVYVPMGVTIGVTICVKGVVITGELVGGKAYFEGVGLDVLGGSGDETLTKAVAEIFSSKAVIYERPDDPEDDWQPLPVGYIHLRNARYVKPGQKPWPDQGFWWRGKLSSVDGFMVGNYT